ncbi:MAG: hypothetical protein N3A69_08535, partial [Leptospiraceae bacterium]|nr:hypothetical protein [Leptospiraceae bacterium]
PDNKAIEKKLGITVYSYILRVKPIQKIPQNYSNIFPIHLEPHKAEVQSFPINPSMDSVIKGKFGTEITIPANSIPLPSLYRKGDIITIELREILNDLDFLTLGVDMLYYDSKSKAHLLESGGMLEIKAIYFSRELGLKRGARLKLKFPKLTNQKMKIYYFAQNGSWIDKGSEEVLPNETIDSQNNFVFGFLDSFGLWNLAYPNSNITCVQGEIKPLQANPPYSVSILGTGYIGAYTKNFNEPQFKINVLQEKEVKIIISDSKGNLGFSNLKTPKNPAFLDFVNYKTVTCDEISKIEIKPTEAKIRADRKKVLELLEIKDRMQE